MQKDSIEALHQNRNPLVQEAGLSSLARVFRDPPAKIIEEVTSWCVKKPKVSTVACVAAPLHPADYVPKAYYIRELQQIEQSFV